MKAKRKNDLKPAKQHKNKAYVMQAVALPCATEGTMPAVCLRGVLHVSFTIYRSVKKIGWNLVQPHTQNRASSNTTSAQLLPNIYPCAITNGLAMLYIIQG